MLCMWQDQNWISHIHYTWELSGCDITCRFTVSCRPGEGLWESLLTRIYGSNIIIEMNKQYVICNTKEKFSFYVLLCYHITQRLSSEEEWQHSCNIFRINTKIWSSIHWQINTGFQYNTNSFFHCYETLFSDGDISQRWNVKLDSDNLLNHKMLLLSYCTKM